MALQISVGELPTWIKLAAKSQNNVLVIGDPGVGKSQVIGSMANEHCKITCMTGSSTIEEYVNGIPTPGESKEEFKCLKYIPPVWLVDMVLWGRDHPNDMQILFIDEFNTADSQVLKTFLTILSERRIPTLNITLPDNVVLVAAMNPHDQNEGEPLIRPMASRFMQLEVKSEMVVYKEFLCGRERPISAEKPTVLEAPVELDATQKCDFVDQISKKEWGTYEPSNGHEINPRSMSNFFRALEYVKYPSRLTANLSQAFLGTRLSYPQKKQAEKAKNIATTADNPYLSNEQLQKLDDNSLVAYYDQLMKSNVKGTAAVKARAEARVLMHTRNLDVNLG